jgi:hypothetical protein
VEPVAEPLPEVKAAAPEEDAVENVSASPKICDRPQPS